MSCQPDQTTDSAGKSDGSDTNAKSHKEGLKIVKGEPLPTELLSEDPPAPEFECPVCLQSASFPVQLPCRHIFCFLCVKGVANRSKRCALCRQEIPADFFNEPKLLYENEIKEKSKTIFDDGYQWFYEGRHGWWQYDERTSVELENRYKKGDKMFELLIAGFLYVIDLENMRQYRRNDQTRRRRIRRDLRTVPDIKGIAGLKFNEEMSLRPSGDGGEAHSSASNNVGSGQANGSNDSSAGSNQPFSLPPPVDGQASVGDDSYLTPPAPNNTPQTPMTPADSQPGSLSGSQEDLSLHLQHLNINSNSSSRGSPSIDHQQFRYPYHYQTPYEGDGQFSPDDPQDNDGQQQTSIHLNSSNSSTDSVPQDILVQDGCPDHLRTNYIEAGGIRESSVDDGHDDGDNTANDLDPRRSINPRASYTETFL